MVLAAKVKTWLDSATPKAAELVAHNVQGKGMRVLSSELLAEGKVRLCAGFRGAVVAVVLLVHAQTPTLHLSLLLGYAGLVQRVLYMCLDKGAAVLALSRRFVQ